MATIIDTGVTEKHELTYGEAILEITRTHDWWRCRYTIGNATVIEEFEPMSLFRLMAILRSKWEIPHDIPLIQKYKKAIV
jgi:hypothetical protein